MSKIFIILLGLLLIGLSVTLYTLTGDKANTAQHNDPTPNNKLPVTEKSINQDLFLLKNTISDAVEGATQDDIQRAVEERINKQTK